VIARRRCVKLQASRFKMESVFHPPWLADPLRESVQERDRVTKFFAQAWAVLLRWFSRR
jgi:hypothetical protein